MNKEIELLHPGGLSSESPNSATLPGWKDTLLAALPFLLVSFSVVMTLFQGISWLNPDSLLGKAVITNSAIIIVITFIGVLIYAWRKD